MAGYSKTVLLRVCPWFLLVYAWGFTCVWTRSDWFPRDFPRFRNPLKHGVCCCWISLIPLASVLLASFWKPTEVMKRVKANTLEQTFLYVVSLLGAETFAQQDEDLLTVTTLCFVAFRYLYWLAYSVSVSTSWNHIRTIAFWGGFINTLLLLEFTLMEFMLSSI